MWKWKRDLFIIIANTFFDYLHRTVVIHIRTQWIIWKIRISHYPCSICENSAKLPLLKGEKNHSNWNGWKNGNKFSFIRNSKCSTHYRSTLKMNPKWYGFFASVAMEIIFVKQSKSLTTHRWITARYHVILIWPVSCLLVTLPYHMIMIIIIIWLWLL